MSALPAAALALALAASPAAPAGASTPPLAGTGSAASPAAAHRPDAFEDDYPAALAAARAREVPILVDVWAPW